MGLFSRNNSGKINWEILSTEEQLTQLKELSKQKPVAIFKHSTRCAISSMAMSRLERGWQLSEQAIKMYYLDLIQYRDVSNKIASIFSVVHQSPQIIVVSAGNVIYHASHGEIVSDTIKNIIED